MGNPLLWFNRSIKYQLTPMLASGLSQQIFHSSLIQLGVCMNESSGPYPGGPPRLACGDMGMMR
jgi:hypothetical protein